METPTKEISSNTIEWIKLLLQNYASDYTQLVDLLGDNQSITAYKNYLKTLEVIRIILDELK